MDRKSEKKNHVGVHRARSKNTFMAFLLIVFHILVAHVKQILQSLTTLYIYKSTEISSR